MHWQWAAASENILGSCTLMTGLEIPAFERQSHGHQGTDRKSTVAAGSSRYLGLVPAATARGQHQLRERRGMDVR